MKKKTKTKNRNSLLFSIFSVPLVALPLGFAAINNTNQTTISLSSKSINDTTVDGNTNLLNAAVAVPDETIKGFNDYIVSYEDKNIAPVNVVMPSETASDQTISALKGGATIGMKDNQTVTCTTYAGLLLWSSKLPQNSLLKQYYSSVKKITDIGTFKVANFAYLESKQTLFVLFGQEVTSNNTKTFQDLVVFGLDINSGDIIVPPNAKLESDQVISGVKNNAAFIFFNSAGDLIVTSGNKPSDINSSSLIVSFDKQDKGFVTLKGSSTDTENFFNSQGISSLKAADQLIGFLPTSTPNYNISLWLFSVGNEGGNFSSEYYKSITEKTSESAASNHKISFNYYVLPMDNNFKIINPNTIDISKHIVNTGKRGYINNITTIPKFENVYKRFFYFGKSGTSENLGILLDSYDAMFASFAKFSYDPSQTTTNTEILYNSDSSTTQNSNSKYGPAISDFTEINDMKSNGWNFNSVAYDKDSNFVHFSLSSQLSKNNTLSEQYLTNTRYVGVSETAANNKVSVDSYSVENPYTLSSVNFQTYKATDEIYLTKHGISDDSANWLSTPVDKLSDNNVDLTPTKNSNIKFSNVYSFINNVKTTNLLNEKMPESINEQDLIAAFKETNPDVTNMDQNVSVSNIKANNVNGNISFSTNITYTNNFGDEKTTEDDKTTYSLNVEMVGFALNDFLFNFKDDTDAAVTEIKEKIDPKTISKGYIVKEFIKELKVKGQDKIQDLVASMIEISYPDETSLKVTITISTKETEGGFLPIGYPQSSLTKEITYTNFTGKEKADFVPMTGQEKDPTIKSKTNGGMSVGVIAGITVACVVVLVLIIAIIAV